MGPKIAKNEQRCRTTEYLSTALENFSGFFKRFRFDSGM
jgi:hypothetical protein